VRPRPAPRSGSGRARCDRRIRARVARRLNGSRPLHPSGRSARVGLRLRSGAKAMGACRPHGVQGFWAYWPQIDW
jgi:hypothetical protein